MFVKEYFLQLRTKNAFAKCAVLVGEPLSYAVHIVTHVIKCSLSVSAYCMQWTEESLEIRLPVMYNFESYDSLKDSQ